MFVVFWYLFDEFDLLDVTDSMIDCQVIMAIWTFCFCIFLVAMKFKEIPKRMAFIIMIQFVGITYAGVLFLLTFGTNIWITRALGYALCITFVLQFIGVSEKQVTPYDFSTWTNFTWITGANVGSAFLAAVFSVSGPPKMIACLMMNFSREQVRNLNGVEELAMYGYKLIFLFMAGAIKTELYEIYISTTVGTFVGAFIGFAVEKYVNQTIFRKIMECFVFVGCVNISFYGFWFSQYLCIANFCAVAIYMALWLSLYYENPKVPIVHRENYQVDLRASILAPMAHRKDSVLFAVDAANENLLNILSAQFGPMEGMTSVERLEKQFRNITDCKGIEFESDIEEDSDPINLPPLNAVKHRQGSTVKSVTAMHSVDESRSDDPDCEEAEVVHIEVTESELEVTIELDSLQTVV